MVCVIIYVQLTIHSFTFSLMGRSPLKEPSCDLNNNLKLFISDSYNETKDCPPEVKKTLASPVATETLDIIT